MENLLRRLQHDKIQQSVLSTTDQINFDNMVSHFGMNDLFCYVFGIDNKLAGSKIARGQELLRISKFKASETVIVGDTLLDLEVARELGIEAILLSHGHQRAERLPSIFGLSTQEHKFMLKTLEAL